MNITYNDLVGAYKVMELAYVPKPYVAKMASVVAKELIEQDLISEDRHGLFIQLNDNTRIDLEIC